MKATSTEKRLAKKQTFPLYISHCRGLTTLKSTDGIQKYHALNTDFTYWKYRQKKADWTKTGIMKQTIKAGTQISCTSKLFGNHINRYINLLINDLY